MGESGAVIVLVFEVVVCGSGSLCNFVKQRAGGSLLMWKWAYRARQCK